MTREEFELILKQNKAKTEEIMKKIAITNKKFDNKLREILSSF